jgi:hypothetical protein
MVSINYAGRLGNNMLQYAAAKIFSNKFKIKLSTPAISGGINFTKLLIINDDSDFESYQNKTIIVNNQNFLELLSKEKCDPANYIFEDFFQIKEFILNYTVNIKNIFQNNTKSIDQVFVHYRIGDIELLQNMLPIDYYIEALEKIGSKKGVISSDSPDHDNVKLLSEKFNLEILVKPPLDTIILGSNYNNLVLSEGTFSWWIGVLSNAEKIIYNNRERFWHGDIFCYDDWIKLNYN